MIAEILLSLFLIWLVRDVVTTYLTRRKMPPGPFPYPFIGNFLQLQCDPVNPYSKLSEKYGDIFSVTFPTANAVVINSASLAREARLGDDIIGRTPESIYPWSVIFTKDLITTDCTPVLPTRRRVFKHAMHVFGAGIEQASERARYAVDLAIEDIDKRNGKPFSPKDLMESSILVHLWEWISSKKVQLDDPIVKNLSKFSAIVAKLALVSNLYQVFPFTSYLPSKYNRDIKLAQQIKEDIFPAEYRAHMKTYTPGVVRDLTDSFISCYEKELARETSAKKVGSMEDIPGLMLDVAFTGTDTTSTSLAWLLLYMVIHPDVQRKIHEELDAVVGRTDRSPTWKDAQNMPYLQATLCEVQRASGLLLYDGTCANRDTTIAGYHIPKGTLIAINYSKLHQDEREWPEPEKFKPERFLDSEGRFVGWSKLHGFLPFSVGRRECPGQSLARIIMFIFASMLLHRYKIEIPEGGKIPSTDVSATALIMRPDDFQVVAREREVINNS